MSSEEMAGVESTAAARSAALAFKVTAILKQHATNIVIVNRRGRRPREKSAD
jgi:hypothetical protein